MPRLFRCIEQFDVYHNEQSERDREYVFTIQVDDLCFEVSSDEYGMLLKNGHDREFTVTYEQLTLYFILA